MRNETTADGISDLYVCFAVKARSLFSGGYRLTCGWDDTWNPHSRHEFFSYNIGTLSSP